jgi:predicted RNase H-like HicB family nuclease
MKYAVIFERSSNGYGAYVPDLPGCVAVGDTLEETQKLIREAIDLHLKGMREDGETAPEPSSFAENIKIETPEKMILELGGEEAELMRWAAELEHVPVSSFITDAGLARAVEIAQRYNREHAEKAKREA